jgi:hypothetical protein
VLELIELAIGHGFDEPESRDLVERTARAAIRRAPLHPLCTHVLRTRVPGCSSTHAFGDPRPSGADPPAP